MRTALNKLSRLVFQMGLLIMAQWAQASPSSHPEQGESSAPPTDERLYALKGSMVKVATTTRNGGHGFGTGIAISKDHVVTNCHVLSHANGISISKWGVEYPPVALQADWYHDLCILRFEWADLTPVTLGVSSTLKLEQPVVSISMPTDSPAPYVELSTIKALYPMDDSVVIRTKAAFSIGASGSPLFDYAGRLIGISTFKSPGKQAFYYNMPVQWVHALLNAPEQKLDAAHDLPFWDAPETARPFFMQVVLPFQHKKWSDLHAVALRWTQQEPHNPEAWFYLGVAELGLKASMPAKSHFQQALELQPDHPATLQYLLKIAQIEQANEQVALLQNKLAQLGPELVSEALSLEW